MVKVLSTPQLVVAARNADRFKYNRRIQTETVQHMLDPDGRHVVAHNQMVSDQGIIRAVILAKYRGDSHPHELVLDLEIGFFNRLTDFEVPEGDDEEEESFA